MTSTLHIVLQKTPKARQALQKVIVDTFAQVEHLHSTLVAFERLHNITKQWVPLLPEWKKSIAYMEVHDYQKALDKLEGLVVQRLFELTKMLVLVHVSTPLYIILIHIIIRI